MNLTTHFVVRVNYFLISHDLTLEFSPGAGRRAARQGDQLHGDPGLWPAVHRQPHGGASREQRNEYGDHEPTQLDLQLQGHGGRRVHQPGAHSVRRPPARWVVIERSLHHVLSAHVVLSTSL